MANEKIYANGLFVDVKNTTFGEITKLSFKTADFAQFLQDHTNEKGYCNVDILNAKEGGKKYAVLNDFKPTGQTNGDSSDLPF
jgi:hypothetical protein